MKNSTLLCLTLGLSLSLAPAQDLMEIPPGLLKGKQFPFLLLTPSETQQIKDRLQSDPVAKSSYGSLVKRVDEFLAQPLRFPKEEGGWTHKFICPECSSALEYRKESPRLHLCKDCGKEWEGLALDQGWNTITMGRVVALMEELGVVALLSEDPRYAVGLKEAWLDLARQYPKYRLHEKDMKFPANPLSTSGRATSQSIEESDLFSKLAYSWDALLATNVLSGKERKLIETNVWQLGNAYFHRVLDLHGSGGNWWVWHNTGALATGIITQDLKLIDKAFNLPKSGILAMINSGYVRDDGLADERSAGYQAYAVKALSRMAHLSKRVGLTFHEHARVKASFTGFMRLLLPDLSFPCMNDGGRVDFGGKIGLVFSDILNLGWSIYGSEEIHKTLQILQNSPAFANGRQEHLYTLTYGPSDLQPKPLDLPSVYMPDSGVALLRAPAKDWTLLLKNNPVPQGHAHPNALQFSMFANGEEFIPAFGTPGYGSPYYLNWYARSLAGNTVILNMLCQSLRGIQNRMDWAITRGPVQAVQGTSRKMQSPSDPGHPLVLSRVVLQTPLALYEILRAQPDKAPKKQPKQPLNQIDSVLHLNGTLTWQTPPVPGQVPWKLPSPESQKAANHQAENRPHARDPFVDYRLLQDPQLLPTGEGEFLRGELSQPKGGKVALALFPLAKGESAWQFMSPGYQDSPTRLLPMVMRRISANEARFGSVAIPFQGENPLRTIKLLGDSPTSSVVQLETTGGTETVLHSSNVGAFRAKEIELKGTLGVITVVNGIRIYTLMGSYLRDESGRVSAEGGVPVQVKIEDGKPSFSNLGDAPVTVHWQAEGSSEIIARQIQPESL